MAVILSYGALKRQNIQLKENIALLQTRVKSLFTVETVNIHKTELLEKEQKKREQIELQIRNLNTSLPKIKSICRRVSRYSFLRWRVNADLSQHSQPPPSLLDLPAPLKLPEPLATPTSSSSYSSFPKYLWGHRTKSYHPRSSPVPLKSVVLTRPSVRCQVHDTEQYKKFMNNISSCIDIWEAKHGIGPPSHILSTPNKKMSYKPRHSYVPPPQQPFHLTSLLRPTLTGPPIRPTFHKNREDKDFGENNKYEPDEETDLDSYEEPEETQGYHELSEVSEDVSYCNEDDNSLSDHLGEVQQDYFGISDNHDDHELNEDEDNSQIGETEDNSVGHLEATDHDFEDTNETSAECECGEDSDKCDDSAQDSDDEDPGDFTDTDEDEPSDYSGYSTS